ncbi:uncharacterized protein LOC110986774 [Acanthaster planci]|uniref:Uncharacterized protein LOC110986774 n=1 Tax=Acanthaster planci TaxID=133434 RepID=A0A8B7ZG64_ACAPL|nr:uncharacterized protein LOC110986774 [Acanthaster planci]
MLWALALPGLLLSRTLIANGAVIPTGRQHDPYSPLSNCSAAKSRTTAKQPDLITRRTPRPRGAPHGWDESLSSPLSSSSFSTFREEALKLHNTARRRTEPPAADMPRLSWSSGLARLAELWSRRCTLDYGLPLTPAPLAYDGRLRQNVWAGPRNGTLAGAVTAWRTEGQEFNYGTGACYHAGGCRHYLTMISASVRDVGCGASVCCDGAIIVCYYGTSSGFDPPTPYTTGPPCTKCGQGEWCDDGLCRTQSQQWTSESADKDCQCDKMENAPSEDLESDDGSLTLGSSIILYRHRRQAVANDSSTPTDCGHLDIPLWVFVGLLVFVVMLGLVMGIVGMTVYICKDTCRACKTRCNSCKRDRSGNEEGGGSSPRHRCCCNRVEPVVGDEAVTGVATQTDQQTHEADQQIHEETNQQRHDEDTPDGPTAQAPCTSGNDQASTRAEPLVEHVEFGVQTDPPREDPGACAEPLVTSVASTSTEEVEYSDKDVCVKPESVEVEVQVYPETQDAQVQMTSENGGPPSPSSPSQAWGVCLRRGCTTCPLHTHNQREVHAERTETIRRVVRANRDTSLRPGDVVF